MSVRARRKCISELLRWPSHPADGVQWGVNSRARPSSLACDSRRLFLLQGVVWS